MEQNAEIRNKGEVMNFELGGKWENKEIGGKIDKET